MYYRYMKTAAYIVIFILPLYLANYSYSQFTRKSEFNKSILAARLNKVAGAQSVYSDNTLLKDIPLPDNSTVLSIDSNDNSTTMSFETNLSESKVIDFYESYLKLNGWQKKEDKTFAKNNYSLSIKIDKNIVLISSIKS